LTDELLRVLLPAELVTELGNQWRETLISRITRYRITAVAVLGFCYALIMLGTYYPNSAFAYEIVKYAIGAVTLPATFAVCVLLPIEHYHTTFEQAMETIVTSLIDILLPFAIVVIGSSLYLKWYWGSHYGGKMALFAVSQTLEMCIYTVAGVGLLILLGMVLGKLRRSR